MVQPSGGSPDEKPDVPVEGHIEFRDERSYRYVDPLSGMGFMSATDLTESQIAALTNPPIPLKPHETETIKLTATFLNGIAIALFAVGALAPLVKVFGDTSHQGAGTTGLVAAICISLSFALHLGARNVLKGLR